MMDQAVVDEFRSGRNVREYFRDKQERELDALLEQDPNEIVLGKHNLTKEVIEALQRKVDEAEAKAYRQQVEMQAAGGGEGYFLKEGEGVTFRVAPLFYHYWGQRLGYECWHDAQFVREFLRDNPSARVKNRSRKVMVGYSGADAPRSRLQVAGCKSEGSPKGGVLVDQFGRAI